MEGRAVTSDWSEVSAGVLLGDEATLFRLAAQREAVFPWNSRLPALFA